MTTKFDIISGVLGAGKTTLINRILDDVLKTGKVAIVENEFGEIGIDGLRLAGSGVTVKEIRGGCVCCTLFGNFVAAVQKLISQVQPDRIIVEPTGVGKLTDVLTAVEAVGKVKPITINMVITIVDTFRHDFYMKMFGDFYKDQIQTARTIFLSRTQLAEKETVEHAVNHLMDQNNNADIITRPWDDLTSAEIIAIGEERKDTCDAVIETLEGNTHHHLKDKEMEVWSIYTSDRYSMEQFEEIINNLEDESKYGLVFRGKGVLQSLEGDWYQYDYIPGETTFHKTSHTDTGKIVFIGQQLNQLALQELIDSFSDIANSG